MIIKQDPVTKLWCRDDGKVLMPPTNNGIRHTYEWVVGHNGVPGYLAVMYQHRLHLVHRVIARAFLPNPDNLPTVDHIDRNPKNNSVDNLRWASYKTQQENNSKVINRADYGVRCCEDRKAYCRAYHDAHKAEIKAYGAAYITAQKAKGLVHRKCPDGKWRWVPKENIKSRSL